MYLFFLPCKPASGDLSSWDCGKLRASAGRVASLFQEVTPVDPPRNGQVAHGFQVFIELVYDLVSIGFGYPHDLRNLCHCDECLVFHIILLPCDSFVGVGGSLFALTPCSHRLSPETSLRFQYLHYTKHYCLCQYVQREN